MVNNKHKKIKFYSFLILLLIIFIYLFSPHFIKNNLQKEKKLTLQPISINLLTNVHPSLSWRFKPLKSNISIIPGEVTTVEYIVENLGPEDSTGIATFVYYPKAIGDYINKLNCFCYDAQTLKPKQKDKFTLIILIDPEVTKDSKTISIKEATIQFTFFDYKKYKKSKN